MSAPFTVTFLGTGTSSGVPMIACKCSVCASKNPKDKRLRSSIMVQTKTTTIVIDTTPDFRQQMLQHKVERLDAVLFTHPHKDHIAGLDDIRAYNYSQGKAIDVFANELTQKAIKNEFHYIFSSDPYPGIPRITLHTITNQKFTIGDIDILPIEVLHLTMPVLAFRINDFTYVTDANYISDAELDKIKGSEALVLNALRKEQHISHFTLSEAIEISNSLQINQTYFTHISHQLGLHDEVNSELPPKKQLAFDGQILYFN